MSTKSDLLDSVSTMHELETLYKAKDITTDEYETKLRELANRDAAELNKIGRSLKAGGNNELTADAVKKVVASATATIGMEIAKRAIGAAIVSSVAQTLAVYATKKKFDEKMTLDDVSEIAPEVVTDVSAYVVGEYVASCAIPRLGLLPGLGVAAIAMCATKFGGNYLYNEFIKPHFDTKAA